MANEIFDKLEETEQAARKMGAVAAFIYELEPEDFINDDGLWSEVVIHGALFIKLESEKIHKLLYKISRSDQALKIISGGKQFEEEPDFAN